MLCVVIHLVAQFLEFVNVGFGASVGAVAALGELVHAFIDVVSVLSLR